MTIWKLRGTIWLVAFDYLASPDPDNRHTFWQAWTHFGSLARDHFKEMSPREAFLHDQSYS